jgi:hypothetical protein
MMNSILKIMGWAAAALVIPLLGNWFVEGWNWSLSDFAFAWVFWVVMATTIFLVTRRAGAYKVIAGTVVFFAFAAVWVVLATG